jgi:hypothetical protein
LTGGHGGPPYGNTHRRVGHRADRQCVNRPMVNGLCGQNKFPLFTRASILTNSGPAGILLPFIFCGFKSYSHWKQTIRTGFYVKQHLYLKNR